MSITVKDLSFSYGSHEVLRNISFSAQYGEFLSVLGPNGVGKSTLFRCMLGLLTPSRGDTVIDGTAVSTLSPPRLARAIAYIPQSHNPVFHYSVYDTVLMGTTAQTGLFSSPGREQAAVTEQALERLSISHLKGRPYGELSGGERQLVLIARAIAQQAKILVMDEPSSSLDFGNRLRLMNTVRGLTADGYCIIQSTHDPDQAFLYSDRILALHEGRVLAHGIPREVITPQTVSTLYGVEVDVRPMLQDRVRVCLPAEFSKETELSQ